MHLAFDATALLGPRTGVGVFTHEVLVRMAADPGVHVTAYGASWRGRHQLRELVPPAVDVVERPMAARPLRASWTRWDQPPIEWWTGAADVVHGPNFVVPPTRRAAQLVTVHDLTCVHFPELCTADTLAYPGLLRRALDRGATVHAVSEYVAAEVRSSFAVDPERVVVVPNGVSPLVAESPTTDAPRGRALVGSERYLLALGTIEPRKDYPTLVRAFDQVADSHPDLDLVIAGPDGWGATALAAAVDASHHRDRIIRRGWVPDDQRSALLRGATAYVYPSRYEGFGLPPLEAMLADCPVVATAAGAVPEVVGDAALLVAVGDTDALAEALTQIVDDEALADGLRDRGRTRASGYSWDKTAEGLAALYSQLVEQRR